MVTGFHGSTGWRGHVGLRAPCVAAPEEPQAPGRASGPECGLPAQLYRSGATVIPLELNEGPLAPEVEVPRYLTEAPRLGAPHPTPCNCDACLNWWTQQDGDQSFINRSMALLCEQR